MKLKLIALMATILGIPLLVFGGVRAYCSYQESLRIHDAAPAFDPLDELRPILLSQPFGSRYCRYLLDFPPDSLLTDDNADLLRSLVLLPQQNTLDVTIRTDRITDASVPLLASLSSIDLLDVTKSGITDGGIVELRVLMPMSEVLARAP